MLKAAWGLTMREKPNTPVKIMAKATGILVHRSANRRRDPEIPIWSGVMGVSSPFPDAANDKK
jgi:hypothetical protein